MALFVINLQRKVERVRKYPELFMKNGVVPENEKAGTRNGLRPEYGTV
jgi:hypothetical protein